MRSCCIAAVLLLLRASAAQPLAKRGTGYDFRDISDLAALHRISWYYNWAVAEVANVSAFARDQKIEFVPMQWSEWAAGSLAADLAPAARALLGPNEPNHHLQANLTPEAAAQLWPTLQKVADERGLRLGSPAAAPCGANCVLADPFEWLDRFLRACQNCRIDFFASHYYACSPRYLAAYVDELARYGRPVWLTEFACPLGPRAGGEATQAAYMANALAVLDDAPAVERYAWFAPRTGDFDWIGPSASLLQPGRAALTPLGMLYAGAAAATASAPAAARQRSEGATAPGGAAAPRLPAEAAQEPAPSPGPPAARPRGAAPAGAGAPAPAAAPGAARGGGWRALCGACTDQGAGLAALPPGPRVARQAHCRRECGFWNYGTGLLSTRAAEQGSWSQQCQYCNDQGAALLGMNDYQERQDWASHCRSCGYDQYGVGLV